MKNSKILCVVLSSLLGLHGGFNNNMNAHKIENSQNTRNTKVGNFKIINLYNRIKELKKKVNDLTKQMEELGKKTDELEKIVSIEPEVEEQKPLRFIFVIDKSGSMSNSRDSIVSGFNEILSENKRLSDEEKAKGSLRKTNITIKFFSSHGKIDKVRDEVDIDSVKSLTREDYDPDGCTALYDAVGSTLNDVLKSIKSDSKEEKPLSNVILFIMTDGWENDSRDYDSEKVKSLIKSFEEKGGEVRFQGAGKDAFEQHKKLGISTKNSTMFENNSFGTADRRFIAKACAEFRQHRN